MAALPDESWWWWITFTAAPATGPVTCGLAECDQEPTKKQKEFAAMVSDAFWKTYRRQLSGHGF